MLETFNQLAGPFQIFQQDVGGFRHILQIIRHIFTARRAGRAQFPKLLRDLFEMRGGSDANTNRGVDLVGNPCNQTTQGRHLFRLDQVVLHTFLLIQGCLQFVFRALPFRHFLLKLIIRMKQGLVHRRQFFIHGRHFFVHGCQFLIQRVKFLGSFLHPAFQRFIGFP